MARADQHGAAADRLTEAVDWYAAQAPGPGSFRECRSRFALSTAEMVKVCRRADTLRAGRHTVDAHGSDFKQNAGGGAGMKE